MVIKGVHAGRAQESQKKDLRRLDPPYQMHHGIDLSKLLRQATKFE